MSSVYAFIVVVTLPFLVALGHDIYLSYETSGLQEFKLSSFGFIWTTYSSDSFKWAANNLEQIYWDVLNVILPWKATIITGILPAIVLPVLLVLRIMCLWPFQELIMTRPRKFRQRR